MYKVDYKGLSLQIILLGKDMWATFRDAISVLKDTGATVMSKYKTFMSPLDHLQPEPAKSLSPVYSRVEGAVKLKLKA